MTSTPDIPAAANTQLYEALARFQAKLPAVSKGGTAQIQSSKGSYSYRYADLADVSQKVLPLLGAVGLAFTSRPTLDAGQLVLAYSLVHSSGERLDGIYPLAGGGNPQAIGSAITYARRYCLCAVTGVAPDDDDDDAQAASPTGHAAQAADAQADGSDLGIWQDVVDAITSQDDADKAIADLRDALRQRQILPARATRIREAIKTKAATLPVASQADELAQQLAVQAQTATDIATLRGIHDEAKRAGKLGVPVSADDYTGTLLTLISGRKAELEERHPA